MNKNFLAFILFVLYFIPAIAYDRHGRDYSVNGGGASSTMFLIIGVIILFLFLWFNSGDKNKN